MITSLPMTSTNLLVPNILLLCNTLLWILEFGWTEEELKSLFRPTILDDMMKVFIGNYLLISGVCFTIILRWVYGTYFISGLYAERLVCLRVWAWSRREQEGVVGQRKCNRIASIPAPHFRPPSDPPLNIPRDWLCFIWPSAKAVSAGTVLQSNFTSRLRCERGAHPEDGVLVSGASVQCVTLLSALPQHVACRFLTVVWCECTSATAHWSIYDDFNARELIVV